MRSAEASPSFARRQSASPTVGVDSEAMSGSVRENEVINCVKAIHPEDPITRPF